MPDYFIGIDCGGTKSEAVLCDQDFRIYAKNRYSGLNLRGLNPNIAASLVKTIIEDLTYRAGMLPYHITLTVLAAAGGGDENTRLQVEQSCKSYLPTQNIKVVSDAEAALNGAFGGKPGIIIIAGTGSIAYGKDLSGKIARAGGCGYLLGDEGSGFHIGKTVLKACLEAHFAGKTVTLAEKICQQWELRNIADTLNTVYSSTTPAAKIAELAPLVISAAEAGDDLAGQIVFSAAQELALLAQALSRTLSFEGGIKLALSGGLFKQGDILVKSVARHLELERFEIVSPAYEPAIGAIIACRDR